MSALKPRTAAAAWLAAMAAAPLLARQGCSATLPALAPPSLLHPLGADPLGRPALCLLAAGAEASLEALAAAAAAALLLVALGFTAAVLPPAAAVTEAAAGLAAGLPRMSLLMLLALVSTTTPPWLVGLVVGGLAGLSGARAAAARAKQLAHAPYVEAARAIGAPRWRIVTRHVAPNAWAGASSHVALAAAAAVYAEAGLTAIGLGDPTVPSWGRMINLVLMTPGAVLTTAGLLQVAAAMAVIAATAYAAYALIAPSGKETLQ